MRVEVREQRLVAAVGAAVAAGVTLVAEGIVYATGDQRATDVLLLVGLVLAAAAFLLLRSLERVPTGSPGAGAALAVVAGVAAQVVALAAGLATDVDLGLVHGLGFLVMGLGLVVYGAVALRRRALPRPLAVILLLMPVLPLVLGELVGAFVEVEGATLVLGLLWLAMAAFLLVATSSRSRPATRRARS